VVQRGITVCYQLLDGGEIVKPRLTIGQIEQHFAERSISMAELVDVTDRCSSEVA
jgi:hypothetical protein